ncbi:MAG: SCP2 sterol-binding domain-containing protein [Gammaproteobacteria bacterium]|nr:SCP2 sterol-binding domain-containing protein [Gammaproteobacteria bacterium]
MKLPQPVWMSIEVAFNRALELDQDARDRLVALSGKVIGMDIRGLDLQLYLMPGLDGVGIAGECDSEVDAWLRGGLFSLMHTAMTHDRDRFLSGDVEIEGDIQLGQKVQNILKHFRFDWEELLSRGVGDVAAHQLGNTLRSLFDWGSTAIESLARDTAEYFQEERRDIVGRYELDQFSHAIDLLRADTERMEQRINRLLNKDKP